MNHQSTFTTAKKALACALCLFTYLLLTPSANAQNLIYAKGFKNTVPNGHEVESRSIQVDEQGNTYVTGFFDYTADFDPGPGIANLTSSGSSDIFIARYNASGGYVYAIAIGGAGSETSHSIAIDGSGNAYITGSFSGTLDFDPGVGVANVSSSGSSDVFVAKYDALGRYVYAIALGGAGSDGGSGIASDILGNIYVAGSFGGTIDFDPGAGTAILDGGGAFLAKYNASGDYVYAKAIGTAGNVSITGIAVNGAGNAHLTGNFTGTVDFDPGDATASMTSATSYDIFIARYDPSGNYLYAKDIGSTEELIMPGITLNDAGNVYATGWFVGTVDFNPEAGEANLTSAGNSDIFVAGYDASGNYVYAKSIGGTGSDRGNSVAVDALGHVYITGYFSGTVDFDPGAGAASLTDAGSGDIFVASYDAQGNYVFAKAMGGSRFDIGYGIAVDGPGNVYATGNFSGMADFDPGPGEAILTIRRFGINAFVSRLSPEGNYAWASQLGNYVLSEASDYGQSIAVDPMGNTVITGSFAGTVDFDPGAGEAILTSYDGTYDIFVARYDARGNYLYAIAMGSTELDAAYSIATDISGNAYVTGFYSGTVDFDPGTGVANLAAGQNTLFFAKYDAAGNYVYAKAIEGTTSSNGIAVDGAGNAYVTGSFLLTVDFNPDAGVANLTSAGGEDIFIAKYDPAGNYVYAKAVGGIMSETAYGIAVDGPGNVYITGRFTGTADFDPGTGTAILISILNTVDVFVAKYGPSGNYVYAKAAGSASSRPDMGYNIAVDGSGNAYITGSFGTGAGTVPSFAIFFSRYDASGNNVYEKLVIGSQIRSQRSAIALDASGNVYLTGSYEGTLYMGSGDSAVILTSKGINDIFLFKYNAAGDYVYAKSVGGTNDDVGAAIAVDGVGNAYLTGSFGGTVNFNAGGGADSILTATSAADVFIAKYGPATGLPVQLLSFTATATRNGNAVQLKWSTASQTNNAFFEVERSTDGARFEVIGRRPGCSTCTGLQQYELFDNAPYGGLSYYRLKQVDHDAGFSYSPTELVTISTSVKTNIQVYPSITFGAFELSIKDNPVKKQVVIRLLNATGILIQQQTVWLNEGDTRFNYSLADQSTGVYYVSVADKDRHTTGTIRIIRK